VTYCEVFAGAAWLLFAKDSAISQTEIINDRHGELTNFYRVVRERPLELIEKLKFRLLSQEDFGRERSVESGSEIERAARFFWLLKQAFGSKMAGQPTFVFRVASPTRFRSERVHAVIEAAHERLKHVTVFSEDCVDLIRRCDRPETFFYCDPPYVGHDSDYKHGFGEADHVRLVSILQALEGTFLLSYNDCDMIKDLYAWATIETVTTKYSLSRTAETRRQPRTELLIRNYEL